MDLYSLEYVWNFRVYAIVHRAQNRVLNRGGFLIGRNHLSWRRRCQPGDRLHNKYYSSMRNTLVRECAYSMDIRTVL